MSVRSSLGLRFAVEELEPRVTPADASFATPVTTDGPATVRFEWGAGGATFQNEIGYYVVDDADGRVAGLRPSDPGYAHAALSRSQVVFASGRGLGAKADLPIDGNRRIGLYLVSNNTTAAALAGQAPVFFSYSAANGDGFDHVRGQARGDGGVDFRFEDQWGGGDQDFNDAVIAVKIGSAVRAAGQAGQTVNATFTLTEQNGNPRGEFGIFQVNDATGRIGDLKPGDPNYARAVMASSSRFTVFPVMSGAGATKTVSLVGGAFYGFYYIAGGPATQLQAVDPDNTGDHGFRAYFSFVDANPDGIDHLRWRSPDTFGIENSFGGDESQDFNDAVIRFGFGTPQDAPVAKSSTEEPTPPEEPSTPPEEPTPPTNTDKTPPVTTFQLTNDTGSSNTDRITSNLQTEVTVTDDASAITGLRAGYDTTDATTFVDILSSLSSGKVTITPALAQQINHGTALANGQRTLRVQATDAAGNASTAEFTFTLDTVAPAVPTFDLAAANDTGTVGDLRTATPSVSLTGTLTGTESGTLVELSRTSAPNAPGSGAVIARATVAANGAFSFTGVALDIGPNSYVVRAVDTAGNRGNTFAQTFVRNTPPTVAAAIGNQTATAGGADLVFNNLDTVFADAERVLRFVTAYPTGQAGNIDINLFATQTPATVANILAYANSVNPAQTLGDSIFHRLDKGFVLQGGGFHFDPSGTNTATTFPAIPSLGAVNNEPGVSNTRGTLAMAKPSGQPNGATSEFFFNLADNSSNLDTQNGGFTVFGQVMNGGQQTLNAIENNMTEFSGTGLPGAGPFPIRAGADTTNFPLNVVATDLAVITSAAELTAAQRMTFSTTSSAPGVATAVVAGTGLTIHPVAAGTTTITVRATDLDGSTTSFTFDVTVS